jgi:hypothetical protein
MRSGRRNVILGTLFLLVCCGPSGETGADFLASDPEAAWRQLENRLLESRELELDFDVRAQGAVEVELKGALSMDSAGTVKLHASGVFAGEEVDLHLASDGKSYEFGKAPNLSAGPTPGHLKEAILIGLTRMGILHNLAMLSAGAPPDRADGGVKNWVTVDGFSLLLPGAPGKDGNGLGFSMTVDGAPVGTASLELDGYGLPVARQQTVFFPEGEMRVVERYGSVKIHP